MRIKLVEIFTDGSNATRLHESVLLERSENISGCAIDEIFSAKDALQAASTASGVYVVILEPDEE